MIKMKRNVRAWKKNKLRRQRFFSVVLHSPPLPTSTDIGKASPCDIQKRAAKRKDLEAAMTVCLMTEVEMEPIPTTANSLVNGHLYYPCSKKIGVIALLYRFMNYQNEYHKWKEGEWPLIRQGIYEWKNMSK